MSKQKKNYAKGQRITEAYGAKPYPYKSRHKPLRSKTKLRFNWFRASKGSNGKYQSGLTRFKLQCARLNEQLVKRDDYTDVVPVNCIHALDARRYPEWEYIGNPNDLDLSPSEYFKKYYLCSPEVQLINQLNLQKELYKSEVKCTVSKSGEINFN